MEENIAQYQPTEIQNQPEKRWLKIGLLALAGLLLAGGLVWAGYQLGQRQTQPPRSLIPAPPTFTPTFMPLSTPTLPPEPTLSPDETAGWKTYSSINYGFQFKYPTRYSLLVEDLCNREPSPYPCDSGSKRYRLKFVSDQYWEGYDLMFYSNLAGLSAREWLDRDIAQAKVKEQKNGQGPYPVPNPSAIVIEKIPGTEEAYQFKSEEHWPPYTFRIVKSQKWLITFLAWQNANPEPSELNILEKNFDLMLSTFKFLD